MEARIAMRLTKAQAAALRRRIARYRDAIIDDAFKGSLHDWDERDEVEAEAIAATKELEKYIDQLTAGK